MIPTEKEAKVLWDKYHLPDSKRRHVVVVAVVALELASLLKPKNKELRTDLILAACLLHDIDKEIPRMDVEKHPDTAVRILQEEGMNEVAELVKKHSLHAILDPKLTPQTLEEKILYLADKMVKYDLVGVDERFNLWRSENLSEENRQLLKSCYPKVKELELKIYKYADITPLEFAKRAKEAILKTISL